MLDKIRSSSLQLTAVFYDERNVSLVAVEVIAVGEIVIVLAYPSPWSEEKIISEFS